MLAVIFVYPEKKATFKIGGAAGAGDTEPLKRIPLGPAKAQSRTYSTAEEAIAAGQSGELGPGIYATRAERDVAPQITAVAGTPGTDYDILTLAGDEKDPWLAPTASTTSLGAEDPLRGRVRAAYASWNVTDADLAKFFAADEPRGIEG